VRDGFDRVFFGAGREGVDKLVRAAIGLVKQGCEGAGVIATDFGGAAALAGVAGAALGVTYGTNCAGADIRRVRGRWIRADVWPKWCAKGRLERLLQCVRSIVQPTAFDLWRRHLGLRSGIGGDLISSSTERSVVG
jgi:hypothetical protein